MRYNLVTKDGKVRSFYCKELAEMYQQFLGGVLLDTDPRAPKTPVAPKRTNLPR